MTRKFLIEIDNIYTDSTSQICDIVVLTDVILSLVTKVSYVKMSHVKDLVHELTVNEYNIHLHLKRPPFRSFLARLAFFCHEKYQVEFLPYGNSFFLSLPMDAPPEAQKKYLVTFENTSARQWIEFKIDDTNNINDVEIDAPRTDC